MKNRYQWAATGDINAFFGLMLDNIANMILTVSLLAIIFGFPAEFAIRYMIPGTAIGVAVGDLIYFFMAFSLAKKTGSQTVTAMPLGLDTPSTIGMVFFVLGPAYSFSLAGLFPEGVVPEGFNANNSAEDYQTALPAAISTWQIGICCIVASGIFKFFCAFVSGWIRRVVPRAGLLGSLAAIALVLIAFIPLVSDIFSLPVVGFTALAIIFATLIAKIQLPFKIPGALGSLLVASAIFYLMMGADYLMFEEGNGLLGGFRSEELDASKGLLPTEWLAAFQMEWVDSFAASTKYFPIVLPFALGTVIGGIDCTESAAAAGDDYHTGTIIFAEGIATLAAGFCGGVQQSTPYIGHPAYKAMGGRAAYTLATALFVLGASLLGFFGYLYLAIPKPALVPILIFVGMEITAQSFQATPKRHYTAVAFACLPAMAALVHIMAAAELADPNAFDGGKWLTIRMLYGGFIITSLIWASSLAAMIDKRLNVAAFYFVVAGVLTLFGVMHSPYADGHLFVPVGNIENFTLDAKFVWPVLQFASGYFLVAILIFALGLMPENRSSGSADSDVVDDPAPDNPKLQAEAVPAGAESE